MEMLICARQVLTGVQGEQISDGAVLVRGHDIIAVGPRSRIEPQMSPLGTMVDFPTSTALPGLMDGHVHLALDASATVVENLAATSDVALMMGMAGRARALVDTGVTTVRDLGDRRGITVALRERVARGKIVGPRIIAATVPLTVPGGHCWFLGGEVEGGERALRDQVQRNVVAGAEVIKIMVTGGRLTPGNAEPWESQFNRDEIRAVVAEAHQLHVRVAAHVHSTQAIADAVQAGVDTLEHATFLSSDSAYGIDVRDDVVQMIVDHGTWVCPTIHCGWQSLAATPGLEWYKAHIERLTSLESRGVKFLFGTDSGIRNAPFDGITGAFEGFVHAGFTPERVIEMATVDTAAALGLSRNVGRLAPRHRADLVVVDGNPLEAISDLRNVRLVVTGGHPHVPTNAVARGTGVAVPGHDRP